MSRVGTRDLEDLLERPMDPPDAEVMAAIGDGPMPAADAVGLDGLERLADPAPLRRENGWCMLEGGVGYVAVRTPMPRVSGPMVDWWFAWHPHEPARYRIWHPRAHHSNSVDLPAERGAKAHWGTVHHPVEDVGTGMVHARISFVAPSELGFAGDHLDDPDVATIVCGLVGDDRLRVTHSVMAHVFLREGDGVVLRSHFWMGARLPGLVRRLAIRPSLPPALARHCAEEYSNLGGLLPLLARRYPDLVPATKDVVAYGLANRMDGANEPSPDPPR